MAKTMKDIVHKPKAAYMLKARWSKESPSRSVALKSENMVF